MALFAKLGITARDTIHILQYINFFIVISFALHASLEYTNRKFVFITLCLLQIFQVIRKFITKLLKHFPVLKSNKNQI